MGTEAESNGLFVALFLMLLSCILYWKKERKKKKGSNMCAVPSNLSPRISESVSPPGIASVVLVAVTERFEDSSVAGWD